MRLDNRAPARGAFVASVLMAVALLGMAGPAGADSACGPGRRLVSEADGQGMSWTCIADTPRVTIAPSGENDRAAAAGVASGVLGVAAVAPDLASRMEATDNQSVASFDTGGAGTRGRELNRQAFEKMNAGSFLQASLLFNMAARNSIMAGNDDEAEANWKNARIARAQDCLNDAVALQERGDIAGANRKYLEARLLAQQAQEEDLASRISEYNDRLIAAAAGSRADLYSYCTYINTRLVCR